MRGSDRRGSGIVEREVVDAVSGRVPVIIDSGFRRGTDIFKALAMGADAIAIGTAAMMAVGCQQYRICDTGNCPVGITTQDPELRKRFNVELSAKRLENYLRATTNELKNLDARERCADSLPTNGAASVPASPLR